MLTLFLKVWKIIDGKKTYIVGFGTIAYAALGFALHQIDATTAFRIVQDSLLAMGIRHAI